MRAELLKSIRTHSFILGAFAIVTALLLGLVKVSTAQRIEQQRIAAERLALYQVLPPAKHNNDILSDTILLQQNSEIFINIDLLGLSESRNLYIARLDDEFSGIIVPVEAHDAYSGDMLILVGINTDSSVSGVRVLSHKETPGLGDKIDLRVSDWILSFNDHSLSSPTTPQWQVKKDGGDFDQFVGATITPRAVVKAVKNTLQFFEDNHSLLLGLETPQ